MLEESMICREGPSTFWWPFREKEKVWGKTGASPSREQVGIFAEFRNVNSLPIQLRFEFVFKHCYGLVATDAFELIRHVICDVVVRLSPRALLLLVSHNRVTGGTTIDSVKCSVEATAMANWPARWRPAGLKRPLAWRFQWSGENVVKVMAGSSRRSPGCLR